MWRNSQVLLMWMMTIAALLDVNYMPGTKYFIVINSSMLIFLYPLLEEPWEIYKDTS